NIANILNPDSVVIGGGVSAAGEFLRIRVEKYFIQYAFPQVRQSTKIKIAELGNDAGIIGAASLASQFLDSGEHIGLDYYYTGYPCCCGLVCVELLQHSPCSAFY